MAAEGLQKSAVLLMSLGEDQAAEVLRHLAPREVQKISQAMADLRNVSHEEIDSVMKDFVQATGSISPFATGTNEYIRNVLTKALGEDVASGLVDRILRTGDTNGIEGLKWLDSESAADLVKNEHPQIIASILVHLDRDQASEILEHFPEELQNDVILRIAMLDGIQPVALEDLNEVLAKLVSGGKNMKKASMGGARTAAEILNFVPNTIEGTVLDNVREYDEELAQKIMDQMFIFENLLDLDDRGIQLLLREVQSESLITALKGASVEVQEKIFRNMSTRAGDTLREDLEAKGPVKLSEVEMEQKEILKTCRRLAEEGQISMGGKGDDAYV
jgi:flagellar motor switch protein FliG